MSPVHYKYGHFPAVNDLPQSLELARGLQAARDCVADVIGKLNAFTNDIDHFVGDVFEVIALGLSLDKQMTRWCISESHFLSVEYPPRLCRPPDNRYVIHDLMCCLEGTDGASISAGVIFLQ